MRDQNRQRVNPTIMQQPVQQTVVNEPFILPSKIQPSSFLKFSDYNNYMRTMSIKF